VQRVLSGNYIPPPGTDPYAAHLLTQLKAPQQVLDAPPVPAQITTQTYRDGWIQVKEHTSSGSNVLHFGHFKAGVKDQTIADFEASMANFPYTTGYSPLRWRHGVDVELLKKPGVYSPETFRTIQLFKPQFNANNKVLGHDTMAHSEKYNLIAEEQYGSRKHK